MLGVINYNDGKYFIEFHGFDISVKKQDLDTFYLGCGDEVRMTLPKNGYLTLKVGSRLVSFEKVPYETRLHASNSST